MQLLITVLACAALASLTECRKIGHGGLFDLWQFRQMGTDMTSPETPTPTGSPDAEMTSPMSPMSATDESDESSESDDMDEDDEEWPYALMEFSGLVGRCVVANLMWSTHKKPKEGILVHACPHVLKAAEHYNEADESTRELAEEFTERVFHLLQCVNLVTEKELLEKSTAITGWPTGDVFLKESRDLFEMCDGVFKDEEKSLKTWATEFDLELSDEERSLDYLLRKAFARAILHR